MSKTATKSKLYKAERYADQSKKKIGIDGNLHHVVGRPVYDDENGTGLCYNCNLFWTKDEQIQYTTKNGNRTFGICPKCRTKHPLRKKPRTRDGYMSRFPPKRID